MCSSTVFYEQSQGDCDWTEAEAETDATHGQMVTLSAAVLLKSLRHSVHIVMPTFHARSEQSKRLSCLSPSSPISFAVCDMVERVAEILKTDAVPPTHVSRSASIALRQAVARVKNIPSA